jgi:hypothetical protein
MKDLKTVLREGDPAATDEGLSLEQMHAMRRAMLNAARQPDVIRTPWQQPLAVAAMVALTIGAGIFAGQHLARINPAPLDPPASAAAPAEGRRQLQFSTPGGTRIIWVFDPDFTVKETVP